MTKETFPSGMLAMRLKVWSKFRKVTKLHVTLLSFYYSLLKVANFNSISVAISLNETSLGHHRTQR